ncbi:hypothetical protein M3P05_05295 [Sansalvadorimonas sp. 2012CJ34-2]|uniref:Uncharacterized protein n=1 Tax=Parendozoicomonas callyspongiae TaxID=2942213 RepID=A0ABT0PDB2_9GAMM|nr:hypothetical protein [Sansalvadorimonas sp. 2012CJ34-2]MCL6269360.1 hypothetical protein [Sansalvadorimonas sp. 2012CJ34-2]
MGKYKKQLLALVLPVATAPYAFAKNLPPAILLDVEASAWFTTCQIVTSIYPETGGIYKTFAEVAPRKNQLMKTRYSVDELKQVHQYSNQLVDQLHARDDLLDGCRFVHRTVTSTVNAYKWGKDETPEAVDFLSWCTVCFNISNTIPRLNQRAPAFQEAYSMRLNFTALTNSAEAADNVLQQTQDHTRLLAGQESIVHYCDLFYRVMLSAMEIYGLEK